MSAVYVQRLDVVVNINSPAWTVSWNLKSRSVDAVAIVRIESLHSAEPL